ncbi:MAG: hypothetical protein JSV19_07115 [Phycisphaerales bacterium]|nr:MAG: hypothetical protein JSV19_07115 [Phycisphaerales bacterium]
MMRGKSGAAAALLILVGVGCAVTSGCGVLNLQRTSFPFAATGDDGSGLFFEDIQEILLDASLTPEQKRDALRDDLGIEDEDLLDALLAG